MADPRNFQTAGKSFDGRQALVGTTSGGREVEEGRTKEDAEKEDDTVLDQLLGRRADERNDFEDADAPIDHGLLDDADAPSKEEEYEDFDFGSESTTAPTDSEYQDALNALGRDGWTPADLEGLSRERLIAIGSKRLSNQRDVDGHYRDSVAQSATRAERPRGQNEAEAAQDKQELIKLPDALKAKLGLDEDGAKDLAEFLRETRAPLQAEQHRQNDAIEQSNYRAYKVEAEAARRELGEDFPQLRDAAVMRRVAARMDRIQQPGGPRSVRDIMEDAAYFELRREIKAEASERTKTVRKTRRNGQPVTTGREPARGKEKREPLTDDQRMDAALHELERTDIGHDERLDRAGRISQLGR